MDVATLYLCRQGARWIVVLDSPEVQGAARLARAGHDGVDARFALLSTVRRACPGADITTTDGVLEGADYEWRLDINGVGVGTGGLGRALQEALAGDPPPHRARAERTDRSWCGHHRPARRPVVVRPLSF